MDSVAESNTAGGRPFMARQFTQDETIYQEIVTNNEYELSGRFEPDDVVVDIGAHIGAFAVACIQRGARYVACYEPNRGNYEVLKTNLQPCLDTVTLCNLAVWRSDVRENIGLVNMGDLTAMHRLAKGGRSIATVSLDDILDQYERVRLLKIDAEGAEYGILMTCTKLAVVEEIVGEYHVNPVPVDGMPDAGMWNLFSFLERNGFSVRRKPNLNQVDEVGLFFATRQ